MSCIGVTSRTSKPPIDAPWEECLDAATGRRYLACATTNESFFTSVDEAAALGWTRYQDPVIGGNGHWWWHELTGRYFADPGRHTMSSSSPRLRPPACPGPADPDVPVRSAQSEILVDRPSDSKSVETARSLPALSDVDVWICLDFEWTCDEGEARQVHCDEGEIIEFAFVVYDAKAKRDLCEGQYYCKPTRTPLTDFCTELTGITEETLADAGSLGDALDAFDDALNNAGVDRQRCCAVAHGACDLELTLPRNCSLIGRAVPPTLRRYIDLREAAQHFVRASGMQNTRASTLREICDALGVDMIGEEHCGLDDAWMVLLSLQALLKAHSDLQMIDIDVEREFFFSPEAADHMIALDGMPFQVKETEVQSWLESLIDGQSSIASVVIVQGVDGRPSGRVVVDLGNHSAAVAAMKVLTCNAWSPGGRTFVYENPRYGMMERLVLARPLRQQERIIFENRD